MRIFFLTLCRSERLKLILVAVLFLGVAGWLCLLLQGLPVGDPDDWDHLLIALDTPWTTLAHHLITPWSTSHEWVGQSDRMDQSLHRRVFMTCLFKAVQSLNESRDFLYYLMLKIIPFSASVTFLFLFLFFMTQSRVWALSGAVFYALIPAHYAHLFWLSDPITLVHFFAFFQIALFLTLKRGLATSAILRTCSRIFGIFLIGWISLKTKEPALSISMALLICLWITSTSWCRKSWLFFLLSAVLMFHIFLIVPVQSIGSEVSRSAISVWHPEILLRMLFKNYDCGYEDERNLALLDPTFVWPVSVLRSLGIGLGWMTLVTAYISLRRRTIATPEGKEPSLKQDALIVFATWLGIEIIFMGFFQPDPRYFSGTMIPLTFLLVVWFHRISKKLSVGRNIYLTGVGLAFLFSLPYNLRAIVSLRFNIGSRVQYYRESANIIYHDLFPGEISDRWDIPRFSTVQYRPLLVTRHIEDYLFYSELGYSGWNKVPDMTNLVTQFEKFSRKGFLYYISEDPLFVNQSAGYPVMLLAALDGKNRASAFENIFYSFKKNAHRPVFIYRWNPHSSDRALGLTDTPGSYPASQISGSWKGGGA